MKTDHFSPVATAEFSKFAGILSATLSQHHPFRICNSSTGIPSPPLALFVVMLPKAHLTCLLRTLYASQEATVRTGHGTTDWFQIGKGVHQDCILSPCLFNLYAEYSTRNFGLDEAKLESRLPGEISITLDMQMTPPLWQKAKRN